MKMWLQRLNRMLLDGTAQKGFCHSAILLSVLSTFFAPYLSIICLFFLLYFHILFCWNLLLHSSSVASAILPQSVCSADCICVCARPLFSEWHFRARCDKWQAERKHFFPVASLISLSAKPWHQLVLKTTHPHMHPHFSSSPQVRMRQKLRAHTQAHRQITSAHESHRQLNSTIKWCLTRGSSPYFCSLAPHPEGLSCSQPRLFSIKRLNHLQIAALFQDLAYGESERQWRDRLFVICSSNSVPFYVT